MSRTRPWVVAMSTALLCLAVTACSSPNSKSGGSSKGSAAGAGGSQDAAQRAARSMGVDLSKCPTDMTKPLSGTIRVGSTMALTGPAAPALLPVADGMKAATAYLNATSGLPVKFSLTILDDQYLPSKASLNGQQLIQSDKVDFLNNPIGTSEVQAVRTLAEQYCVPVLAGNAGGQSANTVSKYPLTVVWSLPAYIDAKAWVDYLKAKFPDGAKVAILTATSDAVGQDYLNAVHELTSGTNIKVVSSTQVAATAAGPPSIQVSQMKASGANVLMAIPTTGPQCASTIKEVANQGWKPDAFLLTSECSTLQLVTPAQKAADGVLCNLYLNDPAAASAASDAGLQKIVAAIKKYEPGAQITGSTIAGFSAIESMFKAAEQAQKSPLGLSRLGVLYAATHMTYQSSTMLPGVVYSLNYPKDEVAMESTQMSRFDASTGQFVKVKLYDYNGLTTGKASG